MLKLKGTHLDAKGVEDHGVEGGGDAEMEYAKPEVLNPSHHLE